MKQSISIIAIIVAIVMTLSNHTNATIVNNKSSINECYLNSSYVSVSVMDTLPPKVSGLDGDGNPLPPGTRWDAKTKKIIIRRTGKIYVAPKNAGTAKATDKPKKKTFDSMEDETTKTNTIPKKDAER
jgi:hypothetical protein